MTKKGVVEKITTPMSTRFHQKVQEIQEYGNGVDALPLNEEPVSPGDDRAI